VLPDIYRTVLSGWRRTVWLAVLLVAPFLLCLVAPGSNPLVAVAVWVALTLRQPWALLVFLLAAFGGFMGSYLAVRAGLAATFWNYFFGGLAATLLVGFFCGLSILIIRVILRWVRTTEGVVQLAIASAVGFAMVGLAPEFFGPPPPADLSDALSFLGHQGGILAAFVGINAGWIVGLTAIFLLLAWEEGQGRPVVSAA